MCTWLSHKWWAAVQVCGTVESAKPAGGWTPVAKSGGQRIVRRPVLRPSVVAFQKKVVRHSIQWRQSHPRSVGFVYGWAETAARGCLGGGGLGTPNATQAREPVGRKPLSPRRGGFLGRVADSSNVTSCEGSASWMSSSFVGRCGGGCVVGCLAG